MTTFNNLRAGNCDDGGDNTALLILVILFLLMSYARHSVIQMLGYALLLMFVGYFAQICSIFDRMERTRRAIATISCSC